MDQWLSNLSPLETYLIAVPAIMLGSILFLVGIILLLRHEPSANLIPDESIYFSIGTISTVGYGDIAPYNSLARVQASLEVSCGIVLLFGVWELLEYAREHRPGRSTK